MLLKTCCRAVCSNQGANKKMNKARKKSKKRSSSGSAKSPTFSPVLNASTTSHSNIGTWIRRTGLWLGSAGFLAIAFGYITDYLGRDVRLEFSQSLSSGYEFVLRNDGPSDQLIQSFRMKPLDKQKVIYTATEDVYATRNADGMVTLPGGNISWVPAYEFKGADGLLLRAKSEKKFRLPPLSSTAWVQPDAALIDFEYTTISQNALLRNIESLFSSIGLNNNVRQASFMVIGNYWTAVEPGRFKDAIDQACSERAVLFKSEICMNRRYR